METLCLLESAETCLMAPVDFVFGSQSKLSYVSKVAPHVPCHCFSLAPAVMHI